MGRSTKKGPYIDIKLLEKVNQLNKTGEKKPIKTWARACTITPEFVGHSFMVHNGRKFLPVYVNAWSVTNWANFRSLAHSRATARRIRKKPRR